MQYQAEGNQNWQAGIELQLKYLDGATRLGRTRHYGPLRIQRPFYPEGKEIAHLYILHPPGGLVAGDELHQKVEALSGSRALVTTPAAGKVYFNNQNSHGRYQKQIVTINVDDKSCVEWLPQETILYRGCAAIMETTVCLKGSGGFIGWDIFCLGRTASGEIFDKGSFQQFVRIERDGVPLFRERLGFQAGSSKQNGLLGFNGCSVYGTMMATLDKEPDIECWHELLNTGCKPSIALTFRNGVLLVRYLGHSSAQGRDLFESVWQLCRPLVNRREACRPRIWNT